MLVEDLLAVFILLALPRDVEPSALGSEVDAADSYEEGSECHGEILRLWSIRFKGTHTHS